MFLAPGSPSPSPFSAISLRYSPHATRAPQLLRLCSPSTHAPRNFDLRSSKQAASLDLLGLPLSDLFRRANPSPPFRRYQIEAFSRPSGRLFGQTGPRHLLDLLVDLFSGAPFATIVQSNGLLGMFTTFVGCDNSHTLYDCCQVKRARRHLGDFAGWAALGTIVQANRLLVIIVAYWVDKVSPPSRRLLSRTGSSSLCDFHSAHSHPLRLL